MQAAKRIGLYGGTFDPIHKGHLQLAQQVYTQLRLDELYLIPAAIPPHKPQGTAFQHRLAMTQLAIESLNAPWQTSDIEARRQGPSYTIDTLRHFAKQFPAGQCWWVLGADALQDLHRWFQVETFHHYARFAVFPRPGYAISCTTDFAERLPQLWQSLDFLTGEGPAFSSTQIKKQLKTQPHKCPDALTEKVYQYIQEHHLYAENVLE